MREQIKRIDQVTRMEHRVTSVFTSSRLIVSMRYVSAKSLGNVEIENSGSWFIQFFSTFVSNSMRSVQIEISIEFFTNYTKMPIVAFSSLLCENKKKTSDKMLPLVGIEPRSPTLTVHLLLWRSLYFCSCTAWFLDFDDSVRINRAWLYKDPKVLALQEIASVAHEGACWTWNLRAWALFPLRVTFCFHVVKTKMPQLAFLCVCGKPY